MKRLLVCALMAGLMAACTDIDNPVDADLELKKGPAGPAAKKAKAPVEKPFKMSRNDLTLDWGIERDQEVACQIQLDPNITEAEDADHIAGGAISGNGNFTHLGRSTIKMSAAWDIGNLLTDDPTFEPQFEPVGPAGGAVAPVLGPDDYPYQFHVDPFSSPPPPLPPDCDDEVVSATGNFLITAANGDQVSGTVVGGETHRLDFTAPDGTVVEGSGVETFAIVQITGGTGRFENASGSFVIHTITRLDFVAFEFVIDLAEVLPGGTIAY